MSLTKLIPLEAALDLYRAEFLAKNGFTERTCTNYIASLSDLQAFLRIRCSLERPDQVAHWHLRMYMNDLESQHLLDSTLRREVSRIQSFFAFLQKNDMIDFNPSTGLMRLNRRNPAGNQAQVLQRLQDFLGEEDMEDEEEQQNIVNEPPAIGTFLAHEIKEHLDTKVVGQESAKIQLSVLLSTHLTWFKHEQRLHHSPNAILIGPTGVGKTHTIRTASEYLKIPFVVVDTTSLVGSGIAGYQIEDVIRDLVRSAKDIIEAERRPRHPNDDIELARRGIIFFDEFDKISTSDLSAYYVSEHLSIQRRLLKLVEGAILPVGIRQHVVEDVDERTIDTSGILVLAGGAFAEIKSASIQTRRPEALARELTKLGLNNNIVSADIHTYGFMPELVARLPILVEFNDLNYEDLRSILNNSLISPTQVWTQHFEQLGKKLIITDDAYNYVVKRALMLKMGARGLHQVLFPTLAKLTYDIEVVEGKEFIVDAKLLMRTEMQSREE